MGRDEKQMREQNASEETEFDEMGVFSKELQHGSLLKKNELQPTDLMNFLGVEEQSAQRRSMRTRGASLGFFTTQATMPRGQRVGG